MAQGEPDIGEKWKFIQQFISDPCDAPWTAYALAIGGATVEAFVNYYNFDPKQVFTDAARAGSGINRMRSGRKGQRGSKSNRSALVRRAGKVVNFDPNANIGRYLGKFSPLAKIPLPGPVGALWASYGMLERFQNWLFMVGLISQWLFRWMSLLEESRFCQAADNMVLLREGDPYQSASLIGEQPIFQSTVVKIRGPITSILSSVGWPPGWYGVLTCSVPWTPNGGTPATRMTVRVRDAASFAILDEYTAEAPGGVPETAGVRIEINRRQTVVVTTELNVGFAIIGPTTLYAQAFQV